MSKIPQKYWEEIEESEWFRRAHEGKSLGRDKYLDEDFYLSDDLEDEDSYLYND